MVSVRFVGLCLRQFRFKDPTKGASKSGMVDDDLFDRAGLFDRACLPRTQNLERKRWKADKKTQTPSKPSCGENEEQVETV